MPSSPVSPSGPARLTSFQSVPSAASTAEDKEFLDEIFQETMAWFIIPSCLNILEEAIRGGHFSDVHRGEFRGKPGAVPRVVAIKELRVRVSDVKEEQQRFRLLMTLFREVLPWARLPGHPHVMPFLGYSFDGLNASLISPWYKNGDVLRFIKKHPEYDRKRIIIEAALGLEHLHSQKPPIIHADFKATNVLIDDQQHVRIGDFGLSQISAASPSGLSTAVGTFRGTPRWAAPELLNGAPHSIESDVWAYGCFVGEVLTGQPPLQNITNDRQFMLTLTGEAYKPDMLFPQIAGTHPVQTILNVCCDESPMSRWRIPDVRVKAESIPSAQFLAISSTPVEKPIAVTYADVTEAADAAAAFELPGKLEILEYVHQGPFHDILRGEWTPPDLKQPHQVAIKRLINFAPLELRNENEVKLIKLLLREVRVLRTLHHPNVLPFLGFQRSPQICLVSSWYNNGNVISYLEKNQDTADRLLLVFQISSGLTYLHLQSIVHGNLKPSNILINSEGEAVVADFRQSWIGDAQHSGLTTSEHQFRDFRYMPPEFSTGPSANSTAGDMYSFAMVALFIFSGKVPFYQSALQPRILMLIVNRQTPSREDHPFPDHLAPDSEKIWRLLDDCWAPEVDARPPSTAIRERFRQIILSKRSRDWVKIGQGVPRRNDGGAHEVNGGDAALSLGAEGSGRLVDMGQHGQGDEEMMALPDIQGSQLGNSTLVVEERDVTPADQIKRRGRRIQWRRLICC
ncbi:hypothetical protein FRB95_004276 [Tulasnella sp. JGI-2019a]|nr:hypothetical protein FRB95_004276 [Tulasnella sp. JGI-2019a]